MKLGLIRRSFRYDGGAETSIRSYLSAFESIGIDVSFLCESWFGPAPGVSPYCFPTKGRRVARSRQFKRAIQSFMETHAGCLYQAHDWIPGAQIVRLGDGLHSVWFEHLKSSRSPLQGQLLKWSQFHRERRQDEVETLNHPDLKTVIVNSNFIGMQVVERYPHLAEKVVLVRNVIRPDLEKAAAETPVINSNVIGFAGSGWFRKGLGSVIRILPKLPDCHLLVVGRDTHEGVFRRLAESQRVSHQISWLGVLPSMEKFYESIGVLVHPALYDPSPNVLVEAMAYGVPVIGSQDTGISDFSDQHGIYVVDHCLDALVEAVHMGLSESLDVRRNLKKVAADYDQRYLVNALSSIYGQ